jgi:hypothetical protein
VGGGQRKKTVPTPVAAKRFVVAARRGGFGGGSAPWGKLPMRRPVAGDASPLSASRPGISKPVSIVGSGTVKKAMARVKLTAMPKSAGGHGQPSNVTKNAATAVSTASPREAGGQGVSAGSMHMSNGKVAAKRGTSAESVGTPSWMQRDSLGSSESANLMASSSRPKASASPPGSFIASVAFAGAAWNSPGALDEMGGAWLVGRAIRLWSEEENLWLYGIVTAYDGREDAVDSTGKTGPACILCSEKRTILISLKGSKVMFYAL